MKQPSARSGNSARTLRVLLLADDHHSHAPTLLEHIDALSRYSRHDVHVFNPRGVPRSVFLDLDDFDVVVIHYSLMILTDSYLSPAFRDAVARFRGVKVQFIQDDYRQVEEMWATMRELGIDVLFTLVPERELGAVWPIEQLPGVHTITTLAGYVPSAAGLLPPVPIDKRPLDIGYRGRVLPPWLGTLGQEKAWIAQGVASRAPAYNLRCDVAWTEGARIYGDSWFEFIRSCRVTLGTESGATITDFDGSIERRTRSYIAEHPEADFWEIHRATLEPYEGNVLMNVISPRIFEAIALRTGLVLFPGEYSGVLEPDRHYITLEKDFANFDEVVTRIRDTTALQTMIDTAHTEIVASGRYSYATLGRALDEALDEAGAGATGREGTPVRLKAARVERAVRLHRPTGRPTRGGARYLALAKLLGRDRRTSSLLLTVARRSELRRAVETRHLLEDALRLAVLRQAHQGRVKYGPAFTVSPIRDERGGTRLISSSEPLDSPVPTDVRFPLTFSHASIGDYLIVPLSRRFWARVPAGAGGGTDHEFTALAALSEHDPGLVAAAAADIVTTPAARPAQTLERPPRLPLPIHVVRFAPHYGRKLRHLGSLLSREEAVRRAVVGARGTEQRAKLAAELAKLDVLRAVTVGSVADVDWLDVRIEKRVLHARSRLAGASVREPGRLDPDEFDRVLWDHSDVGLVAKLRRPYGEVQYGLLPDGVLEVDLTVKRIGDDAGARDLRRWLIQGLDGLELARSGLHPCDR